MPLDVLCMGTMTLYYRSIWPIARRLIQDGHTVYMIKRGCFSEAYVRENPKAVTLLDENALRFICDLVGLNYVGIDKVRWIDESGPPRPERGGLGGIGKFFHKLVGNAPKSFDIVLSVNKCFQELSAFSNGKTLLVALPYQNIPDLYISRCFSLPHALSPEADHLFELRKLATTAKVDWFHSGLPFVDMLVEKRSETPCPGSQKRVLLLHPGGRRGVVSNDGDSYDTCLGNQRALYKRVQQQLPAGWKLGLKIHPLAAKWHDVETNQPICDELGIALHPGDWPGQYIYAYDAIISLGSSLIFENTGSGVPCFVAGFLGGARVDYYTSLSEFYLKAPDDLRHALLNTNAYVEKQNENKVLREFRSDGMVTEDIVRRIYELS